LAEIVPVYQAREPTDLLIITPFARSMTTVEFTVEADAKRQGPGIEDLAIVETKAMTIDRIIEAPLISVVVPVFNCEKYLAAAIESILAQNYRPIQLIVVDDGSTDNSAAVARRFDQVEYHFQEHAGVTTALNTGVSATKGSFIACLDSDDLWTEGKLT
jgi:hypothetical protein